MLIGLVPAACGTASKPSFSTESAPSDLQEDYVYTIGPGDRLNIFIWRNPDVSVENVPVRPDGKFSTPLVPEMMASGKTPPQLAHDIKESLEKYIKNPAVTVIVVDFVGEYYEQVRVVGKAVTPQALPYRRHMTVLDVMIAVGGLTEFAAGNRAKLIRTIDGKQEERRVRLDDLIRDGDINANIKLMPGDILLIPEAWF